MNQKKKSRCCVPICKGERLDLAHKFPRDPDRCLKWLELLDSPELKAIPMNKLCQVYQVCCRHFRSEDYKHSKSRSLNMNAIPSLNLKNLSQLHLSKSSDMEEGAVVDTNMMVQSLTKDDVEEAPTLVSGTDDPNEYDGVELRDGESCAASKELNVEGGEEEEESECEIYSTFFEVRHPRYENKLSLNSLWLRCHCRCSACYDPIKCRRKFSPTDIPITIQPKSIIQSDSMDILKIEWQDGHKSEHDVNFLFAKLNECSSRNIDQIPWYGHSNEILEFKSLEFSELVSSDQLVKAAFYNLSQLGVTMVQNISTQSQAMAKLAAMRLFPQLQHIHFKEFDETHTDVCSNFTYSNGECGLKCFFITQQTDMILVDGLSAAMELRLTNYKAFMTLCKVNVPLELNDRSVKWNLTAPIIETDPTTKEILHLRLDVHHIGLLDTVPHEDVENFYDSLRQLVDETKAKENQWSVTLKPGTMVILDNWRIFHKCLGQTGISQCYFDRKDFISRIRFLGLK